MGGTGVCHHCLASNSGECYVGRGLENGYLLDFSMESASGAYSSNDGSLEIRFSMFSEANQMADCVASYVAHSGLKLWDISSELLGYFRDILMVDVTGCIYSMALQGNQFPQKKKRKKKLV